MDIKKVLTKYDPSQITIAVVGSHSALDVCRGAKDLGFKTLVIAQKGREKVYEKYYKTRSSHPGASAIGSLNKKDAITPFQHDERELGCVDEILLVDSFKDILSPEITQKLQEMNAIFIPHRSFEVYVNDYDGIENWEVPMFGNRFLLRSEERGSGSDLDQYKIMDEAGIRYPKQFKSPREIDTNPPTLAIIKVLEKERGFERAFFLASSYAEFIDKSKDRIKKGEFTEEQLSNCVIEEFLLGVQVNFNFFYDPINQRVELLGTDTRRQTNHEGLSRLSPEYQNEFRDAGGRIKYEEAGHIAVTVLESMLEPAFELGEKFVAATQKLSAPGVIGPFGLQSMIIPGPPKKEIIVFDVSPRMPGSPGIFATPYSGYLFGENMSVGKRVATQIKEALEKGELEKILT